LIESSGFANYLDPIVGTIEDFQEEGLTLGDYIVQRPFVKAIMEESNISSVAIRPVTADPLTGNLVRFGGSGLDRDNRPNLSIKRLSFWEDYSRKDATLVAYVDGVNTISPVNGVSFLSPNWVTRLNNTAVPDLVVWGTGSKGCFEVTVAKKDFKPISSFVGKVLPQGNKQVISILDQGHDWEPNGTMAVLTYPKEPIAYWTFDRHESLFDDSNQSRFQPSPAWIRGLNRKLTHHYSFEEEEGTYVFDKITDNNISMGTDFNMSDESRWAWGAKGRSIEFNGTNGANRISFPDIIHHQDSNFTFSAWLKPNDDFTLKIGMKELDYVHSTGVLTFNNDTGLTLTRLSENSQWMHFGFVQYNNTKAHIYLDGQRIFVTPNLGSSDIELSDYNGLVDEVQYFETIFQESLVKELAGRVFLDLSGNKLHAVPIGVDLPLSDPTADSGISTDRPTWIETLEAGLAPHGSPNGLGDSFKGENHGRSLFWNQSSDLYLDLGNHISNLGALNVGTLCFWIKTDGLDENDEPTELSIFSASNSEDNSTFFRVMLKNTGVLQLHAVNQGIEVAKFYTPTPEGRIGSGNPGLSSWRHVALVVDETQSFFWVDGVRIPSIPYAEGAGNARGFFADIENLDTISIGRHETSKGIDYFQGKLDDFYLYGRPLGEEEINYLYDLRAGRESQPRLEAVVDAIGSIEVKSGGGGYRELPDVKFSLGKDANNTSGLPEFSNSYIKPHGSLEYNSTSLKIMTYHHGSGNTPTTNWRVKRTINKEKKITEEDLNASAWREYHRPFGEPIFEQTRVEELVWMKDLQRDANLTLPDGREVKSRYVEYVIPGSSGYLASPNSHLNDQNFSAAKGLFGYSSSPALHIDGNATAYILYYADLEESGYIVNSGRGLQKNNFNSQDVFRVAGKGYMSEMGSYKQVEDFFGNLSIEEVVTSAKENQNLTQSSYINFGGDYEKYMRDFEQSTKLGEPRDFIVDINKTISHVTVTSPGQGYAMPADVKILGGYPTDEDLRAHVAAHSSAYEFRPAVIRIEEIDENGSILSLFIEDNGTGYTYKPEIVITGGGGYGAKVNDNDVTIKDGSVQDVNVSFSGRGYFNIAHNNFPSVQIPFNEPLEQGERNASLEVRLGGRLDLKSQKDLLYPSKDGGNKWGNKDPWIEIWDLDRNETQIDENESRAHAVAKVENGIITKVIVTSSGKGYRNPIAIVRGGPPKDLAHYKYSSSDTTLNSQNGKYVTRNSKQKRYTRYWKCTNVRETLGGKFVLCGHTEWGLYPPEKCPGESFDDTNLTEERTPEVINAWAKAHLDNGKCAHHICSSTDFRVRPEDGTYETLAGDNNSSHMNMQFKSRVCSGTKINFKLLNDPYRWPYENWQAFDAEIIPFVENGQIKSFKVVDGGQMYLSSRVETIGTGAGVEIIPVFGDDGNFLSKTTPEKPNFIFDDPQLSNIEIDNIPIPKGSGQGFKERPWARDGVDLNTDLGGDWYLDNVPTKGSDKFGYGEVAFYTTYLPDVELMKIDDAEEKSFQVGLTFHDFLGDRVSEVRILDPGLFKDDRELEDLEIKINYDFQSTISGEVQSVARARLDSTYSLTKIVLDQNASYRDSDDKNEIIDNLFVGLYKEEPYVYSLVRNVEVENPSTLDLFRLNGQFGYDKSSNLNYYDIYVDQSFPNQFYFGFESPHGFGDFNYSLPAMGGKVTVTEGLPEMNWGRPLSLKDAVDRNNTAYSDQYGHYVLPNLSPGIYNVAVFVEDIHYQESTFRPDQNISRVSEVVYVPGLPELELITDFKGIGASKLIWSENSKLLSIPSKNLPSDRYIFSFNGKSYEIIKQTANWADAAEIATMMNGKLVEIESIEEQNAIFKEIIDAGLDAANTIAPDGGGGAYLWIGGNDIAVEGSWVWNGDNDLLNVPFWEGARDGIAVNNSFVNWGSFFGFQFEPDDFNQQDALAISLNGWPLGSAGQWNDVDQSNLLYSIVEYDSVVPTIKNDIRLNIPKIKGIVEDIANKRKMLNLFNSNLSTDRNIKSLTERIDLAELLNGLFQDYEYWLERKRLEGIGAGFRDNKKPKLSVVPHPNNLSDAIPELSLEVNVDGSLNIQIIDTAQSSTFNPMDKFTVFYSSAIDGVDFYEDFHYSVSDQSGWGGTLMSKDSGTTRLTILPSDAGGINPLEIPLSNEEDGNYSFTLTAMIFDAEGNSIDANQTNWELLFDFNATEGNQSRIAYLTNTTGSSTSMYLYSGMRSGRVIDVKVLQSGSNYTDGSQVYMVGSGFGFEGVLQTDAGGRIKNISIIEEGNGYDEDSFFLIDDPGGLGGYISPILSIGYGKIKASFVTEAGQILESEAKFFASMRSKLSPREEWLDKIYNSIDMKGRDATWWDADDDLDGLSNFHEFSYNTHPLILDSDFDGLSDFNETNSSNFKTNPRSYDTDLDGLSDGVEAMLGSNPMTIDSDGDGFDDYTESITKGMDITKPSKLGKIAGIIWKKGEFSGDLYLKLEQGNPTFSEAFFDGNESFSFLSSNSFPYEYIRVNLPLNQHYRVTAFVDVNENGILDTNEITDNWQGYLTESFFEADLTMYDKAPSLEFMDNHGSQLQVDRGEKLSFQVMAFDYPDQNWTIETAVYPRKIDLNGSALAILDLNGSGGAVKIDAPYGDYEIVFTATDNSGSVSSPLVRNIKVTDLNPPTISLLTLDEDGKPAPYKWVFGQPWDSENLRGRAFLANDYPSGQDLTDEVIISGNINPNVLGKSEIFLKVSDVSGKSTSQSLTIEVQDQTSPEINLKIDVPIVRLLGEKFTLPSSFFTVNDNLDGDLSENLIVLGTNGLNINSTTPQVITLQVSDSSGNTKTLSVEVIFEKPGFSFNGFAIDGYLIGSEVWFYPLDENLQNLSRSVMTDANGSYQLNFLSSEFQQLDVNNNGVIDLSEGSLSVIGGIDSTTNREFTGMLKADPGASVITPLTAVIHAMMDAGQTKGEALIATANAFGYPAEIDVTNYDPFQAAGLGDVDSKKILQSSALVANMMKQAEIFAEISALSTTTGETSVSIVQELAEMASSGESLSLALINPTNLKDIFEKSFQRIKPEFVISSKELDQFASISSASNLAISDSTLLELEPAKLAGEISNRQIAVEQEVIVELEEVASGQRSLVGLAQEVDLVDLVEVSNSMPNFNQYSPVASNFSVFLTDDSFQSGATLTKLNASDPDGDVVVVEIIQGNTDVDGDGSLPLQLSSDLDLIVGDAFDLSQLSASDFNVTFRVSDAGGKSINIFGSFIKAGEDSPLVPVLLFEGKGTGLADWYSSSWLGNFYAKDHKWMYHEKIGWLYLHANTGNGFWCWDSHYQDWWWSSEQVFPYAYLRGNLNETQGWIYFKLNDEKLQVYEFSSMSWRKNEF
jgi:hypothetical protein